MAKTKVIRGSEPPAEVADLMFPTSLNLLKMASAFGGKTPTITGDFGSQAVVYFAVNVPSKDANLFNDVITSQLKHALELLDDLKKAAKEASRG